MLIVFNKNDEMLGLINDELYNAISSSLVANEMYVDDEENYDDSCEVAD